MVHTSIGICLANNLLWNKRKRLPRNNYALINLTDNVISVTFSAIMNCNAVLHLNLNIDTALLTSAFKGGEFFGLYVLENP